MDTSDRKRHAEEQQQESAKGLVVIELLGLEESNAYDHHTDDYETDALIIRRGITFNLDVVLEAPYSKESKFHLQFDVLKNTKRRKPIKVFLKSAENDKDDWSFNINESQETKLSLSVFVPATALVSRYTLSFVAVQEEDGKKKQTAFPYSKDVYILFNPWCEDDEVYMEDESLKKEYVLNDTGAIYWGAGRAKPWFFGQFTDAALIATFKLLEIATANRRDNAREVTRHMSAMANSYELYRHKGLLAGNWTGDYSGGVAPWKWSGSVKILKKFLETGEPVQYGQCWVFSGLITSMMRVLGIPARSVTNYDSAHDTDNNCTFDKYFDENSNYLEDDSDDSCWNFHVWNDVWMARPDLPAGMGGWQAIDGTPQEESRGVYRCGPAPLQAIKEGNVHYNYDTKFVFAEVNADTVFWRRNGDDWEPLKVESDSVGHNMSTKKPNSSWREDVTNEYKHPEGSLLERAAVKNALRRTKNPAIKAQANDVKFKSFLPGNVSCDTCVELVITAKNESSKVLTIESVVTAQLVRYNGVTLLKMKHQRERKTLGANEEIEFKFSYEPAEYLDKIDENVTVRLSYMSSVIQTKQMYVDQKVCVIDKPELTLELIGLKDTKVMAGDKVDLKITVPSVCSAGRFKQCALEFEGSILENDITFDITDSEADGELVVEKSFYVRKNLKKRKNQSLLVTFSSKQMSGITGEMEFEVSV